MARNHIQRWRDDVLMQRRASGASVLRLSFVIYALLERTV